MAESQNTEWKESWRDEYLKWICGFANAQGGRIYIGTDDHGAVIGVSDSKRLLEDIPIEDIMVKFTPLVQSKVPEKSDDTLDGTLSGTLEEKILLVIKENPEATQAKLALKVGCSERTVKRIMKEMVKNNIIERVGGRKMGKWVEKRKY